MLLKIFRAICKKIGFEYFTSVYIIQTLAGFDITRKPLETTDYILAFKSVLCCREPSYSYFSLLQFVFAL